MKKTAKILAGLLITALVLAGCGSGSGNSGSSKSSGSSGSQGGDHKILVVYYSASGNTEAVAKEIADATGADTFEITPKQAYTDEDLDYTNENSRVNREHEDESLQDQVELESTEVENWDSYDIVFFGYPIWWGNAAWPVNQFVKNVDFSGKTVIPFCTSASSGLGDSAKNLEKMSGTGSWQEGMRFDENPDEADVTGWAEEVVNNA